MDKHVERQQQQRGRSGVEFILGRGVGVCALDGGRLGYMTFVSMVMVSLSPTRNVLMCVRASCCIHVCVFCVMAFFFFVVNK